MTYKTAAVTFHICLQKQHPPMDSSLSSAIGTHPSDRQSFVFLWSCRRKLVGRHLHICDLLGRVYGLLSITIEQLLLRLDHRLADRYKPENLNLTYLFCRGALTGYILPSSVFSVLFNFPQWLLYETITTNDGWGSAGGTVLNLMIPVSGS